MRSNQRLKGFSKLLFMGIVLVGVVAAVLYVFRVEVFGQVMLKQAFAAFLLGLFLPSVFLTHPLTKGGPHNKIPWYDVVLAGLSVVGPAFIFFNALRLVESLWILQPPAITVVLGLITWFLILEGVRRVSGWPLVVVAGFFSFYPLFAYNMPGILFAKSYSIQRLAAYHFLGWDSIWGMPMDVFGNILIGFMFFGAAMEASGASKFLFDMSLGLVGKVRGGPAVVTVLASTFMGMLSGSPVANVATIGTITIPAMKKIGYEPHMAGAIEACASNGGVLMPPVMGAVAFVMAGLLEMPYAEVALAAFLPMVVYYTALLFQVAFHAQRNQFATWPASELPRVRDTFKKGWFYIGSVVVLLYFLFQVRVESWAPYYASLFLFLCAFLRKETRPNRQSLEKFLLSLGKMLAFLAPMLAAVGLLIGGLSLNGLAQSISSDLMVMAKGNLYLLLGLGAIAAIILGTGMPSIPCYLFTALIFAPGLIKAGVYPLSAHLFFLYWGMISFITPPVCPAVYAACAIAESPVMRTGLAAMRVGIVIFLIPFAFVFDPALLANGSPLEITLSLAAALAGAFLLAVGLEGYLMKVGRIGPPLRALSLCLGLGLLLGLPLAKTAGVLG